MFTLRNLTWLLMPLLVLGQARPALAANAEIDTAFVMTALGNLDKGDDSAIMELGNSLNANPEYFQQLQQSLTPPPVDLGQGRKKKANGAKAMAIFGAVMAFVSCAMMMAAAAKMPPGPERTMMMAQAMQQCGQAAQNLANAGDNDDAGNAVTSQPTQMPQVAKTSGIPSLKNSNSALPSFSSNSPTVAEPTKLPEVGEITVPDIKGPTNPASTVTAAKPEEFVFPAETFENAPKQLPLIKGANLGVDEGAGLDSKNPLSGSVFKSGAQTSLAGAVPPPTEGLGQGAGSGGGDRVRGGTSESASGSSGGGSASDSSGEKKEPFSLSSLFPNKGEDDANGGPGTEVLGGLPRNKKDPKNRLNIFEYASLRYRRAAHEEGRIQPRLVGQRPGGAPPANPADMQAALGQ